MTFTDDDLKRLKLSVNMAPVDAEIHAVKVSGLLARLEVAEAMKTVLEECERSLKKNGFIDIHNRSELAVFIKARTL